MSVQRWDMSPAFMDAITDGEYVTYADHARIVAEEVDKARRENAYLPSVKAAFDRGYEQGKADMEQAHAAALAEAVDEGRKFVLAIWDDGYNVEQRMAAAFRKGQETAAPRTLTADDPEPAAWSIVRDREGVAFQLYLGWRSPDAFYMLWPDFIAARGPVTLIHDGGA